MVSHHDPSQISLLSLIPNAPGSRQRCSSPSRHPPLTSHCSPTLYFSVSEKEYFKLPLWTTIQSKFKITIPGHQESAKQESRQMNVLDPNGEITVLRCRIRVWRHVPPYIKVFAVIQNRVNTLSSKYFFVQKNEIFNVFAIYCRISARNGKNARNWQYLEKGRSWFHFLHFNLREKRLTIPQKRLS